MINVSGLPTSNTSGLSWTKVKENLLTYFGPRHPLKESINALIRFRKSESESMLTSTNKFREIAFELFYLLPSWSPKKSRLY